MYERKKKLESRMYMYIQQEVEQCFIRFGSWRRETAAPDFFPTSKSETIKSE